MKKILNRFSLKAVVLLMCLFGTGAPGVYAANVFINLVAVNASETESKEAPIKYYLPAELHAEDVTNTNGLELDYDLDKAAWFVHGSIKLEPKESKTIKLEVADVWQVDAEEVEVLKNQIDGNVSLLEGREYYDAALLVKEDMFRRLDYIIAQQTGYTENIERRIEEYRAHVDMLNKIRDNAFSLDYFKDAQSRIVDEATVRFVIEVKNPSDMETRQVKHKHLLPDEVKAEDVVEREGFDVRFDNEKNQTFLSKEEEFQPGENKKYNIVIKDVWQIPLDEIGLLREKTNKNMEEIADSEYGGNASYLANRIFLNLERIETSQSDKSDMKRYIGSYRANLKRIEDAKKDLDKLDKLLAFVKAKKLEEFEKSKVKNILQKITALRGIAALSKAIFGKRPSITMTWKVIWGTMAFVAFFTTIHFFIVSRINWINTPLCLIRSTAYLFCALFPQAKII